MPSASKSASANDLFAALTRAYVNASAECGTLLKTYELTLPKYQVLRIVKDHGGKLSAGLISAEMSFPSSDLTRLLDGLERAGLVERVRGKEDRRVVIVHLTAAANKVLRSVEGPLERCVAGQFKGLSKADQDHLFKLLERVNA